MAIPPPVSITKEDNLVMPTTDSPLNPPIITHTAATPMATPQGSPNENATKDINNKLVVTQMIQKSTLSVDSADRSSVSALFKMFTCLTLRVQDKSRYSIFQLIVKWFIYADIVHLFSNSYYLYSDYFLRDKVGKFTNDAQLEMARLLVVLIHVWQISDDTAS